MPRAYFVSGAAYSQHFVSSRVQEMPLQCAIDMHLA